MSTGIVFFLPVFAILRGVPNKVGGIVAMASVFIFKLKQDQVGKKNYVPELRAVIHSWSLIISDFSKFHFRISCASNIN